MKHLLLVISMIGLLTACNSKPKVIEAEESTSETQQPSADESATGANPHSNLSNTVPTDKNLKIEPPPGGITINELFTNTKKYEGQTIKVKGRCVKLNNMIMNRNWIHLQDGSTKDADADLTVTTTEDVTLGAIVVFEGKIALNKDFGAGYTYEVIMEEGKIIQ